MKAIPQNVLALIGCVVVVLVIMSVFVAYSAKPPQQRQAIHIHDTNLMMSDSGGMLKIGDMKPNSMAWFYYPDPDRFKDRDPFDRFLLIRLPDHLGGIVNDASAFRAYSAIDLSSHCFVKYWPQEGRKRIEDPCGGSTYEPVSGYLLVIGGNPILVSKNAALPYLQLSSDEDGYLYVEPPVWTGDKNGVIGIGRTISEQEIKSTSEFTAIREQQIKDAMQRFAVPERFLTGHQLVRISDDGIRMKSAQYASPDPEHRQIMLYYEYCNCTKTKELLWDEESRVGGQLVELEGVSMVAYPKLLNYSGGIHDRYVFVFYDNGYKISLHANQMMESGLSLVRELLDLND